MTVHLADVCFLAIWNSGNCISKVEVFGDINDKEKKYKEGICYYQNSENVTFEAKEYIQ